MVRTTVMLPAALKTQAQRLAQKSGSTLGELVRKGLALVIQNGAHGRDGDILHLGSFTGPRESAADIADVLYGGAKR
jgi:hypothetical protein